MKDTLFFSLYSKANHPADTSLFSAYPNVEQYQQNAKQKLDNSIFTEHLLHSQDEQYLNRNLQNNDYFFPFLIGNLIILITVLTLYRKQFFQTILALFSAKYYQQIELKTIIKHPITVIFFFVYIINLSLLTELLSLEKNLTLSIPSLDFSITFFSIATSIAIYYFIKVISILASAQVFRVPNFGRIYIDYLFIWMMAIAVFNGVYLWFMVYFDNWILLPILITIWILLSILRIAQTLLRIIPKSDFNLFHFFMYLCAVEILPLIVLGKIVMLELK